MSCAVFFISLPSFIGGFHGYSFKLLGDITALFVFVSEWAVGEGVWGRRLSRGGGVGCDTHDSTGAGRMIGTSSCKTCDFF